MAIKFTRKPSDYISESAYVYDVAQTSQYFDKSVYEGLAATGDQEAVQQYIYGIAGARDKTITNFNETDYKYLSNEDKAGYTLTLLYEDPESEAYKTAMEYYNYKVQEGVDRETYESLNGFQRTMASIGGIVGNAVNETLLGTIEGLVDLGAVVVGQKEWAATDFTGVGANRESLQRFSRAYSYLDKNKVWGVANDVVTGIAQMTPMFIPYVGTAIYFGSMAGNTAADAVRVNPDIDYLSLIGYTAAVTGVEFATEKISAGIFGGTGNFIDSKLFGTATRKGLTKVGQKAASNWVYRIGLNFISEGLEESIAEFADTALFNLFIAQGNNELRKSYSIQDVLYAGLIGGLIGGLMEGGNIATTSKLVLTEDGQLVSREYAQQNNLKISKEFSKTQTLSLREQLAQAKKYIETSAVADLQTKYKDLTLEQIKTQHAQEYEKALKRDSQIQQDATGVALGLVKVFEMAGSEQFQRAVDLANGTYENRQTLLQNYLESIEGFQRRKTLAVDEKINNALYKEYGEGVEFLRQRTGLTARQIRLQQNLKNRYGIDVYFGSFASKDGTNKKFGLTISDSEIVIDEQQFGEMSEQEILDKVIKEELVHTIQFTKDVITPKTLYKILEVTGNLDIAPQQLDPAYEGASPITKLAEAQAKAVAEVLLFDDLTVDKMFKTSYSTFNKLYRVFNQIRTSIENSKELRTQKGKMKYHQLLESMKMYRDAAANYLGTLDNVLKFSKDYQLRTDEQERLKNAYVENPTTEPIEQWTEAVFKRTQKPIEGQVSVEELLPTEKEPETKTSPEITTKDGKKINIESEIARIHRQYVKKAKNKRALSLSAGTQLDIFDYIDENLTELEKETTRLRAVEQELDTIELRDLVEEKTLKDKADKLREICSELVKSEYQGDIENHKFATLSNEIFEKEASFFGEITSNEWQALYKYLITQLGDVRADAAANAVLRYGYLHRKQFTDIQDLIKVIYANKMSSSAQLMGLSSHDYNNHSIQSFVNEVAIQNKVSEIPLPKELLLKTAPEHKNIDEFTNAVETEIKNLSKQIKDTTDPYLKWELNRQKASKERILTAIEDNEIALALDEQMSTILESNENVTENLQKQADTYRAIIEWLLEHATFDKDKLSGFSDKKIPLSKNLEKAKTFFEGLESFRYMMMLSNPATAVKNAASNTLILGQSYIEDFGTKLLEKSKWLSETRQGAYTGEYTPEFKAWVQNTYLKRVEADAEGDKYTSNELRRLQQQYAEAKDPIKKNKLLNTIQSFERKMLSDKFWVTHRTMMNLTNTLAGTSNLILSDCEQWLINNYRNGIPAKDITTQQLINNISKTNKELSDLYSRSINGDKVAIMELATKLNLDIVSPDLKKQNSIYYHSFYRANKMFFKIDNSFTRWMSDIGHRHPAIAYVVRHFIPFIRVTANSTSYIIDRSPVGLVKGIFKALQTKAKWSYQKRYAIEHYYMEQYTKIMRENNPKFKFNQTEFDAWLNENVNNQTLNAINGDKQALDIVFDQMADQGMINSGQIGSDNLFARAESMELISQGFLGTALLGLGILLGQVTDAFDYDDDELYGPVIKIGDIKLGIGDLSPFSTLFSMGAMIKNDNIDNKLETVFKIFADATILSTLDSALSYSNGVWDYFKNQSVNIVAQYQPAITKALSKVVYNTKKDKTGTWGEKLLKTLGANSLLFNYLVPNKINPYTGEPEKYYDTGWFEGLFDVVLPVGLKVDGRSEFEKEAAELGAETTGFSGSFIINDKDYKMTGKTKEKYAKYKAQYVNERFNNIVSGKEKVTIKDEKTGKYKTVKYESLTNKEKQKVLKNLYSTSTTITKIQYWLDQGNSYYVTDRDQYYEYKRLFGNSAKIVYKNTWSKSKFVEG